MQASSGAAPIILARHMGSPCFQLNFKNIIEDHLLTQPRPGDLTLQGDHHVLELEIHSRTEEGEVRTQREVQYFIPITIVTT